MASIMEDLGLLYERFGQRAMEFSTAIIVALAFKYHFTPERLFTNVFPTLSLAVLLFVQLRASGLPN